jgi:mRNA-degrading endonuclease toxin of MazEF toxin-antitoxin module
VVVSVNAIQASLNLAVVVPLTSPVNKETNRRKDEGDLARFRKRILESAKQRISGEPRECVGESIALAEQVRVMSTSRFKNPPFAILSKSAMSDIELGLAFVQGLPPPSTRMPLMPPVGPKSTPVEEEKKTIPGLPGDVK